MGVKKATSIFSKDSLVASTLKRERELIIKERGASSDYQPVVAIDVSIYMMRSLTGSTLTSKLLSQFHANPPVPVTAVSASVIDRAKIYLKHRWRVILVFDGKRHPLKEEENAARTEKTNRVAKEAMLKDAYNNPDKYTTEKVHTVQKEAMYPRDDVVGEVVSCGTKNGMLVVGAPFEADHQILALQNQQIIDAADSKDTDLVGIGVKRVINKLESKGGITFMSYWKLVKDTLPKLFGIEGRAVHHDELRLFCCMLGNDFLVKGMPGDGKVACVAKMKTFLSKTTPEARAAFISEYATNHAQTPKFLKAYFAWRHCAAFIVVPTAEGVLPQEALFSGDHSVELGSMTADPDHRSVNFYVPEESNPKLGYAPHTLLREGHVYSVGATIPSYKDFFLLNVYARKGKTLPRVSPQLNRAGEEVRPGAIIDFGAVPIRFIHTRCLEYWLSCRGVSTSDMSRKDVISVIDLLRDKVDALPKGVLRGGGAYVCVSIMEPPTSGPSIEWKRGNDALAEIRSEKCECLDDINFIREHFKNVHNSKRERCLKHLKGGSFDLSDIAVTSGLTSQLKPDTNFFVVEFRCAPSMKGLGTEGKVYPLRLTFCQSEEGWILMPTPYSLCPCPVGVLDDCAHRGGAILLLWAIRNRFGGLDMDELMKLLPPNIHAVARVVHLVHYVYPAPYSKEHRTAREIKLEAKRRAKSDSVNAEDGDNDIVLEMHNNAEAASGDAASSSLIDLCANISLWCNEIEASIVARGFAHNQDINQSRAAGESAAAVDTDPRSRHLFNLRCYRRRKSVEGEHMPKTLYGHYSRELVKDHLNEGEMEAMDMKDYFCSPYDLIYPDGESDGGDSDDQLFASRYEYIGENHASDGDSDYQEGESESESESESSSD